MNGIADGVKGSGDALGGCVPTGQIAESEVLLDAEVGQGTAKDVASASSSRCSLVLCGLESVLVQKLCVRQFVGQRAAFSR